MTLEKIILFCKIAKLQDCVVYGVCMRVCERREREIVHIFVHSQTRTLTDILTVVCSACNSFSATHKRAVLKRSQNFRPSAVRQCPPLSDSPLTDGPTKNKKLLLTLPLSDVQPGVNPIQCLIFD